MQMRQHSSSHIPLSGLTSAFTGRLRIACKGSLSSYKELFMGQWCASEVRLRVAGPCLSVPSCALTRHGCPGIERRPSCPWLRGCPLCPLRWVHRLQGPCVTLVLRHAHHVRQVKGYAVRR